jgi:hypothetical protein
MYAVLALSGKGRDYIEDGSVVLMHVNWSEVVESMSSGAVVTDHRE